jgi:hypothetical protein
MGGEAVTPLASFTVTPAKAGVHGCLSSRCEADMDSGFRRNDGVVVARRVGNAATPLPWGRGWREAPGEGEEDSFLAPSPCPSPRGGEGTNTTKAEHSSGGAH